MSQTKVQLINNVSGDSGFGTSSPAEKLVVNGAIVASGAVSNPSSYTDTGLYIQNKGSSIFDIGAWRSGASVSELSFSTDSGSDAAPVERMRLDKDGKLGIGTTSPSQQLTMASSGDSKINIKGHGSSTGYFIGMPSATNAQVWNAENGYIQFATNDTERMRIDSNGKVTLNTTSTQGGHYLSLRSDGGASLVIRRDSTSGAVANFMYNDSFVGSIQVNTGSTAYNTSSDYRLKENATAISDGITRLKTLKPYRFNWKADKSTTVDGFFAHEVTAVPEAITGTKDEVDSENNPKYQAIDQSKLVPLLTAALQEEIAKREALQTRVEALEAA